MDAKRLILCIAAALLAAPTFVAAQQTIYKWVDKDGKTIFSDTPPPKDVTSSTQKTVASDSASSAIPGLPYATQVAMERNPVTLFTGDECGVYCDQGRAYLSKRGVPFRERNINVDPKAVADVKTAVGSLLIPVLTIGGSTLKGYDEGQWTSSLDGAGYPRTALPNQPNPRATPPAAPRKAPEPVVATPAPAEPAPETK